MQTILLGEAGSLEVDESKFTATVNSYIFNYGLKQMLNDVFSGETTKKTPDAETRKANKRALAEKKLASLYAGEVAVARESGDAVQRTMVDLAETELKAKIKAAGKKISDYKPEALREAAKKHAAANETRFRTAAEAILAIKVEPAESDVNIDELFATDEPDEEVADEDAGEDAGDTE